MLAILSSIILSSAQAGGLGLISHYGIHEGKAYYYRDDGLQGIDSQYLPNYGLGFEALLGDNDDRLQGLIRLSWNRDAPLNKPEMVTEEGYEYFYPPAHELPARNEGLVSIGLQWGIWGEPTEFQIIGTTSLVSGFWTVDNLEYFTPEAAIGATYTVDERVQFQMTLAASPRYRKQLYVGGNSYLSVRYLFD